MRRIPSFVLPLILVLLTNNLTLSAQEGGAQPQQSFFDSATLNQMLSDEEATGLRFYVAQQSESSSLSIMAIGIRADGSENYSWLNGNKKYKIFETLDPEAGPQIIQLSKAAATSACQYAEVTCGNSFSANFSRADILGLLNVAGASGIAVNEID